jgi:endogenous inhibitor of DNA gyrase (YacG/DUF329 family)
MTESNPPARESMSDRFRRAALIDLNNWRDPQHDLDALRQATPDERAEIERFLLSRGVNHCMDVEALALLDSPAAQQALRAAFTAGPLEIRAAVALFAPALVPASERIAELLRRIDECDVYNGLSLTLSQLESDHPPEVIVAMLRRILRDPGVSAVHFAGLLLYLHQQAAEPFDWEQRPFLLRFNPGDEADRQQAFAELCQRIGLSNWAARFSVLDDDSNQPSDR